MELSSELISQFARITNDEPTVNEGSTVYATYRLQGESAYVQIDGSDTITPVATTAGAKSGDRVTVLIKDHKAIVTGNLTDPSANTSTVENLSGTVGGLGTLIDGAARVATNYIDFREPTGLVIGNLTDSTLGKNILIDAQSISVRDGSTILAEYSANDIYLGYSNRQANIDLCNGLGTITAIYDQDYADWNKLAIDSIGGICLSAQVGWAELNSVYGSIATGGDGEISLTVNKGGAGTEIRMYPGEIDIYANTSSTSPRIHMYAGGGTISNFTISGYATTSELSNYYTSGDNIYANKLYIQGAGNISGDPNARLAASSPNQLGYPSGSSRKFKHDIKPVENAELDPEHLYDIEVVQFKYNDDYLEENDQRYGIDCIGFIAEQVNEVYPIAADRETGEPRNWEMRYIIPPMLALIQQQKKKIDELESRINELESKGVA